MKTFNTFFEPFSVCLNRYHFHEGESLEISLKYFAAKQEKARLFARLKNTRHSLPRKKENYPVFKTNGAYLYAEIRIPDHPLKTPNAGIYELQIFTLNAENDLKILWRHPIIVNHFSHSAPYNHPVLVPAPQKLLFSGSGLQVQPDMAPEAIIFNGSWKQLEKETIREHVGGLFQTFSKNEDSSTTNGFIKIQRLKKIDPLYNKPESYRFKIESKDTVIPEIFISSNSLEGILNAFKTIKQLIVKKPESLFMPLCEIEDWPVVQNRGIIEGFYGTPWTHQERLGLIEYSSALKMNMFFYAPKDDPFHRKEWQKPYPDDRFQQLKELIYTSRKHRMNFVFSLSPGDSIQYTKQKDLDQLLDKMTRIGDLGVRHFALLMDDIVESLSNQEDQKRFHSSLGKAHAFLANYLFTELEKKYGSIRFYFCPTEYYQQENSTYKNDIKNNLGPLIPVIWTGQGVFSKVIDQQNYQLISNQFGHDLFLWDNFPVNDGDFTTLFLGPLTNRSYDLTKNCESMITNLMPQAELSKIPLGTIADYYWNPGSYSPAKSWENSLHLYSDDDYSDALRRFSNHFLHSRIFAASHLKLQTLWEQWLQSNCSIESGKILKRELVLEKKAATKLKQWENKAFQKNARGHLDEWYREVSLLNKLIKMKQNGSLNVSQTEVLTNQISNLSFYNYSLSGGMLVSMILHLLQEASIQWQWESETF